MANEPINFTSSGGSAIAVNIDRYSDADGHGGRRMAIVAIANDGLGVSDYAYTV